MSRAVYSIIVLALALSPVGATFAWAGDAGKEMRIAQAASGKQPDPGSVAAAGASSSAPIIWMPPASGAPVERVGGAVRGSSALPTPRALVPSQAALTLQATPSLFWHLDAGAPEDVQLFFSIIEEDGDLPLTEVELDLPPKAGIQRVRLADHGVALEQGKSYEWSVSLVPDINRRAKDAVTMGSIQRVSLRWLSNAR